MLKYTICFIKDKNKLLLLNREKNPNIGMWNGVGGKIEQNETPLECVLREVYEETGITLLDVESGGKVVWKSNRGDSGMYVFIADLPSGTSYNTPFKVEEGILDWKDIDWILDPLNSGIVGNLREYLPKLINGEYNLQHNFTYKDGNMLDYYAEQITEEEVHFN
ncbi:NUDIX hydrolase [Oceanobacillus sojae]|uniref:7,8-dihydro-8-oxoguanine triphosphatase n=1 Tax=Oceanobacillus sojae TaxID=582851 RepID=A0A511ZQP2_9BACI|nr:8-oxo-dGTP diphosphatase [Oceanobacillus sojae]GEN89773.1 7,8-dihydro-8-oxoguanine triphosphatase [Oceanobacillus sojae]